MTLGPVRVMGAGVVMIMCVEEVNSLFYVEIRTGFNEPHQIVYNMYLYVHHVCTCICAYVYMYVCVCIHVS